MSDCEHRKDGEDFCADCPLRPVRAQCQREGYCQRTHATLPFPLLTRFILCLLSALCLMVVPVVIRALYRLQVEDDVPNVVVGLFWAFAPVVVAGVIVLSLFGLYASVFSRWGPRGA